MGHGDELAIVDRNFPAMSLGSRVVRLDGADTDKAGRAILSVLPLDTFVDTPVVRMEVTDAPDEIPPVQANFLTLVEEIEQRPIGAASLSRQAFYEKARLAYAVVVTGELRPYGCFILVKGAVFGSAVAGESVLTPVEERRLSLLDRSP
jgi:L-fucose mutarotase